MSNYRRIIEERVGRPLTWNEEVHHVNGDHSDDRPGNLLLVSRALHLQIHGAMRARKREWLESAAYRWINPPKGYTYQETIEITRCSNPSYLAECGELEWVDLGEHGWGWEQGFTIPSVDAFVARGGLHGMRVAS